MTRCYEVMTTITTDCQENKMVPTLHDAGAGSTLIGEDVLLTTWLDEVQPIREL